VVVVLVDVWSAAYILFIQLKDLISHVVLVDVWSAAYILFIHLKDLITQSTF
jgi:hypothetical protein